MAKINQDLLQAIADKQNVSPGAVYRQITRLVRDTFLERDLAALVVASKHRINTNKYSSHDQRDRVRSYLTGGNRAGADVHAAPPPAPRGRERPARKAKGKVKTKGNSVFVVHGRDEPLRKSMFEFLRSLSLNPMEWDHAVAAAKGANPYIGQILDAAMEKVQAVIVLLSPDEMAHLKEQFWGADDKTGDGKPGGQARPNVLFEAGLALGAHPEKTVMVQVGKLRPFSDIAGKHLVKLTGETSRRNDLANRLEKIGCDVNRVGSDWMTAGNFEPSEPRITRPRPRRQSK